MKIKLLSTSEAVADEAARTLRDVARAVPEGRRVAVALSGGSTPAALYRRVVDAHLGEIPWGRLEVFFGDERAVPRDHPESNYRLARDLLLSRVPVPEEQVHRMPADDPDPDGAAQRYEDEIRRHVAPGPGGMPAFDLIWLGLGEDGHTASLFPGTAAVEEKRRLVVAGRGPAPTPGRLTLTLPSINAARKVQFLVVGARKADMVRRILVPPASPQGYDAASTVLPAALVDPVNGKLEWLLDRDAASGVRGQGWIA